MRTWKFILIACIIVGHVSHIHTMTQEEKQIFYAVKRGNYQETEKLLKTSPNLANANGGLGNTPLHIAAANGHTQLSRLLIDTYKADPNAKDHYQQTPLHKAAMNGHTQLAQLLIDKNADPNASNKTQDTPLHFASFNGQTQLARLLIDTYKADPNTRDEDQLTPLHYAARNGRTQLAQLLIKYKANPNAKDRDQVTPLHLATITGHTQIAQLLIKNNATIDARNNTQLTLLHIAALYGHAVTSWWLIALGANWKAQDEYGDTPQTITGYPSLFTKAPEKRILFDEILPKIMNSNNNKISEYADFIMAQAARSHHADITVLKQEPFVAPIATMVALGQGGFAMALQLCNHKKASKHVIDSAMLCTEILSMLPSYQYKKQLQEQFVAPMHTTYGEKRLGRGVLCALGYFIQKHELASSIVEQIINNHNQNIKQFEDDKGNTVLHYLAYDPHLVQLVPHVLEYGITETSRSRNNVNETPIMIANVNNNPDFINVMKAHISGKVLDLKKQQPIPPEIIGTIKSYVHYPLQ